MSMKALRASILALSITLILGLAACDPPQEPEMEPTEAEDEEVTEAEEPVAYASVDEVLEAYPEADAAALMQPVGDSRTEGYVLFEQRDEELHVTVRLRGLDPQPERRGFHVHEHGSCEPGEDGTPAGAAGGHFAPFGHPHGGLEDPPQQRHVGDFGNLTVDSDGTVETSFTDTVASLEGEASIIGQALIVHAEEDDLETQPTGDSGARVSCGIITAR